MKLPTYTLTTRTMLMIAKELNSPRLSEIAIFIGFLKLVISRYAMIVVVESMQVDLTVVGEYRKDKLSPNQKSRHVCYGKGDLFDLSEGTCHGFPNSFKASVSCCSALFQVSISPRYFSGLWKKGDHVQLGVLSNSGPTITK
jgi:hypothetical protein